MEEYNWLSKEDSEKLVFQYLDAVGKYYTDGRSGDKRLIISINSMPANPKVREEMWAYMIDESVPQD